MLPLAHRQLIFSFINFSRFQIRTPVRERTRGPTPSLCDGVSARQRNMAPYTSAVLFRTLLRARGVLCTQFLGDATQFLGDATQSQAGVERGGQPGNKRCVLCHPSPFLVAGSSEKAIYRESRLHRSSFLKKKVRSLPDRGD